MDEHVGPLGLEVLRIENAPPQAQAALREVQAAFGFVPNLMGILANAPPLLDGYRALSACLERTSLSVEERQAVLLAVSRENRCGYCVAAHTAIAGMQHVDPEVIRRLREGEQLSDARLEALRAFAAELAATRGWPSEERSAAFSAAGYTRAQALEVVLGVALKTLSNYANHLAATPLDPAFAAAAIEFDAPAGASQASGR